MSDIISENIVSSIFTPAIDGILRNYFKIKSAYTVIDDMIKQSQEILSDKIYRSRKVLRNQLSRCELALFRKLAENRSLIAIQPRLLPKPRAEFKQVSNCKLSTSRNFLKILLPSGITIRIGLNNRGNKELVTRSRCEYIFHAVDSAGTITTIAETATESQFKIALCLAYIRSKSFKMNRYSRTVLYSKSENVSSSRRLGKFVFKFLRQKYAEGANLKFNISRGELVFTQCGLYHFEPSPIPNPILNLVYRISNYR